jgi:hypothetical protein
VAESTWPELARVVTMDAVDTNYVWYPPGAPWSALGGEDFDKGYEFWRASVGRKQTKPPDKGLVQLPAAGDASQSLPIVTGKSRR